MTQPPPNATDEQWRALVWSLVWWITEGGPEPFAALQDAKRKMMEATNAD